MKKCKANRILSVFVVSVLLAGMLQVPVPVQAAEEPNTILINEIESDDAAGGNDWVEIINAGSTDVDISGWFITDDKQLERFTEKKTTPAAKGTTLKAGEILVFEDQINFDFGLGKEDMICLYDGNQKLMDSYSYTGHAKGTYSRVIGGDTFVDQQPTKGIANTPGDAVDPEESFVINEINSSPDDYVEFMNASNKEIDISGYEIRDNSDDHRWRFPDNTKAAAGKLILVEAATIGNCYDDQTDSYESGEFQEAIGIGSGDSIRLYDEKGELIDEYAWTGHASYEGKEDAASYGRYPDGTGSFMLTKETPGAPNEWYAPQLVINEVESNGDVTDWVEVYNVGTAAIDLSGYYMLDNDPVGHAKDVTPIAEGTMLEPGAYYVFDQNKDFTFGLGNGDSVTIFTKDGVAVAKYVYTEHAKGVYARIPDGTGEFVDFPTATKGKANIVTNPVVLNEIQSNDPDKGPDWIELANPTSNALDISGLVIKDDDDTHSYTIPAGTSIPANGFLVLDDTQFGFGLGKDDHVRIFEDGRLIQNTAWTGHTNPTWGLYPDVNGKEYRSTQVATPGAANKYADIPEVLPWDGSNEVSVFDTQKTFLEDSSGLDFHNGQLYAVDNGTATFWILDVALDGTLKFAEGFENGKRVAYQKDAGNPSAPGPDAEGIAVDGDGFVYLATERDNSAKGVNDDKILKVDPNTAGDYITASQEWDITALLPPVSANMGIEAVEWVSNSAVDGLLYDQNTKAPYDHNNYSDAVAGGVFFTALEDNGHVYAFALNNDSTATLIADIDSKIGGAMALDYDTYENVLWVASDNGYNNRLAKLTLNGTEAVQTVHMAAPTGLDTTLNYEGFAIADASYTVNGQRPVYRFQDGVAEGALSIGSISCDYTISPETPEKPDNPENSEGQVNPGNPQNSENLEKQEALGNSQNPGTGNIPDLQLWFAIVLISLCVLSLVLYKKSRTKTN